ncbi:MaoC family dehydratase N-terminal domain-containing protein [Croceicoccus sp. BE223]|uniref:FAS1-like dehydratase domain-containing protein n=1 Tax=Croceicoccus sp. BE223 TaxID=2817716 RepID=UPI00285721AE|nr:MaoC family dehydratase N-terminal domain-containing protein [Croceicoccus sp. BE223]MDR7103724.1 3-methylfumaryl-CoA hydratase [Croceicoccus sp. BE223]
MTNEQVLERHVGREAILADVVDPERMERLAALLDKRWTSADPIPPLGHFLLFRPAELQSRIGPDGHPLRDPEGMLPAIDLPRRMWAGSRIRFVGDMCPGTVVTRKSRLQSAVPKFGKTGSMVFCTVTHEIRDEAGNLLIAEEQDIVYREAHAGPDLAARPTVPANFVPSHTATIMADPVMLFRYSGLTFNSHRIHYDREYAAREEGYQGLVVHGPYLATMLFDHLRKVAGGRRIAEFAFRAVSPSFDGEELTLGALVDGDRVNLSIANPSGLGMTGSAKLAD